MKHKKTICFTHYDLDGAASYLALTWYLPKISIDYETATAQNFRTTFLKWLGTHNIEDYNKIFILDLDVSDNIDLVDKENVVIIDHHLTHKNNAKYTKAKFVIKDEDSAVLLINRTFSTLTNIKLDRNKLALIALANDYDSFKLKNPQSIDLNTIFWKTNKHFESFIETYKKGFYGFTFQQQNIIKIHNTELEEMKRSLEVYSGYVDVLGKKKFVCACFADKNIDQLCHFLLKEKNADIAILVNLNQNHISLRRNKDDINNKDIDLGEWAKELGEDYGGGHPYAAGTTITDTFMEFTKLLEKN